MLVPEKGVKLSLAMIYQIAFGCTVATSFTGHLLAALQGKAVTGSHMKDVLTTSAIVFYAIAIILSVFLLCIRAIERDYVAVVIWAFMTFSLTCSLRFLLRDDNWFNDQWKRLKRKAKKMSKQLQSIFTPRAVPAFG